MEHQLTIYNTLDRKKELFVPLHAPHVGMYVCGPTVYGDAHLGHARPAITFDVLFRYLTHLGYKVRYVRNITDVGHLEHDADEGEDKIAKKARLEELEPMEVVQYYLNRYHKAMEALNVLSPPLFSRASTTSSADDSAAMSRLRCKKPTGPGVDSPGAYSLRMQPFCSMVCRRATLAAG